MQNLLLIGIGNEYRRDDGVGLVIVRQLRSVVPIDVKVLELSGEGATLMEAWQTGATVYVFDAVRSQATPGTIHQIDAKTQTVPTQFFHYSTHAFSLAEAVELGRVLNQLPPKLVLYGVEGADFGSGVGLSDCVEVAVPKVIDRVLQQITH
jgi:hydrogenase maturation protease